METSGEVPPPRNKLLAIPIWSSTNTDSKTPIYPLLPISWEKRTNKKLTIREATANRESDSNNKLMPQSLTPLWQMLQLISIKQFKIKMSSSRRWISS